MESVGHAPQRRKVPLRLSDSNERVATPCCTREFINESGRNGANFFAFCHKFAPKSDDFPKALSVPTGTRKTSDAVAPPIKPRAALKHLLILQQAEILIKLHHP